MKKLLGFLGVGALAYFVFKPKTAAAAEGAPTPELPAPPVPVPVPEAAIPASVPATQRPSGKVGDETVGPKTPIEGGQLYTIKGPAKKGDAGDSLTNIAERTYGNYRWWPFLWDWNRKRLGRATPDLVIPGDQIEIPSKAALPLGQQKEHFARADEHKKIWTAWLRAKKKGFPKLPDTVLNPPG